MNIIYSDIFVKLYDVRYILISLSGIYLFYRFFKWAYRGYRVRRSYHDIISLPRHLLWGNLVNAGAKLNPSLNRHPDYGFEEIWHDLGQPGCFLIDLAPVDRAFLVVAEPQYIEPLVNPSDQFKYSIPKSETYHALKPLIGSESMVTKEGDEWKTMRKRFNPGFQPKYIHSLVGSVVSKTEIFVSRLKAASESGISFRLGDYAEDLTIDIITQLTIAKDLNAQSTPEGQGEKSLTGILTACRRLAELSYATGQGISLHMIDPIRPIKSFFYEQVFDRRLTAIIAARVAQVQGNDKLEDAKSITQLAVAGMTPTPELIKNCVHQAKSFLFAGSDTTATLIQWLCYEMSLASHSPHHAAILAKLRAEHDAVFGSQDPFSAIPTLLSITAKAETILGNKLPYTTAFIKETLRLHTPAGTARVIPDSAGLLLSLNNDNNSDDEQQRPLSRLDGLRVYPCHYLIHRNPAVWGADAAVFRPERWLDDAYMAKLPAGAYRPFERGPRNCIGQELAMMEGRVVTAAVARGFDFEKVGLTGRVVDGVQEKEVWSCLTATSVPCDGMVMRVKMRGQGGGGNPDVK